MLSSYGRVVSGHRDLAASEASKVCQSLEELRAEVKELRTGIVRRISPIAWLLRRMKAREIGAGTRSLRWLEEQVRAEESELEKVRSAASWTVSDVELRLRRVLQEKQAIEKARGRADRELLRTSNPMGVPSLSDEYHRLLIQAEMELEALRRGRANEGGGD